MRLSEVFRRHCLRLELKGSKLRQRHERYVRRFLSFQTEPWNQITEELLYEFSRQPHYNADTAVALRHWLRSLHQQGVIQVAWHEEVPKPAYRRPKRRSVPTHSQVVTVLESLQDDPEELQMRAILEVTYGSGVRVGELIALDLGDLRWSEGLLVVRKTKNRQERVVPLTAWALHALGQYLENVRPLWREEHSGNALWLGPERGFRLPNYYVHKFLRRRPAGFTMHALRHSCATRLLEGGASVREVQELLGHRCLRSTQTYTHLQTLHLLQMHQAYHPRKLPPPSH